MGRPKKATNPYRSNETVYWTESFYDSLGRVTKIKTPDNAEVNTAYSLATTGSQIGTAVTVTDQARKQRRSIANALGQLKRVDEPTDTGGLGAIDNPNQYTAYSYDILNNLTTVNQGVQTRSFVYDSLSRLKSATNPESGLIQYAYDNNGNLATKIDARNITTTYAYDNLNRVKTRTYSDSTPAVSYFYDNVTNAKGKLTKVTNGTGTDRSTTEYTSFDILGRVTRSKQTTDGVVYGTDAAPMTYTYNLSGALIEQQYPSGRVVKNTLDADGDLQQVQSAKLNQGLRNYANAFTYTSAGAVSSMRLGNGKFENTQFNSRLQPTQIGLGSSATSQNLLKLNFDYGTTDNNGNVKSQTITVPTTGSNAGFTAVQSYNYDSLNRIKDSTEMIGTTQTWKQTYTFDRYGNRNFDTTANRTTTIPNGCPVNVCNPSANPQTNKLVGTNYDSAGNTILDASNQIFVYDAENKQVQVSNAQGIIGNYFYDGDGKRVKKIVQSTGEITIFVYDASGKSIAEYSTIVASSQDAKVAYLTNDHLGSPRINTDQNGVVIARHDYMPFGEEITTSQRTTGLNYSGDSVRKKFTGYERDTETDLDFAKNRYHNFDLGRFTSPDPYKIVAEIKFEKTVERADRMLKAYISQSQKWNQYSYAINNPLRYTDPTGEEIWLRGTAEEIAEAEKLLKEILGDERYKYVKRQDHNGDDGYALVLNIDAKDIEAFSKIGDDIHNKALSEGMAQILSSSNVLEVRLDGNFANMQGKLVDVDKARENPMEPEADAGYVGFSWNINKHAQAVIGPDSVAKSNKIDADRARTGRGLAEDGTALSYTKAGALAHEIGHHWKKSGGGDGAVAFENAVRSRTSQRLRRAEN